MKKYNSILAGLLHNYPSYLIFFVTARCNSKCRMCFYWKEIEKAKNKKELSIKEIEKIRTAALLHDCEKNSKNGNNHSFLSSFVAKNKFCITDKKILNAIKNHTYGHRNMDIISRIIYISDMSEPSRKFKEAEQIRKLAFKNLNEAMLLAISTKLKYVLQDRKPVSLEGVILYNKLIKTVTGNW